MIQELLGWSDGAVQIIRAAFIMLLAVVQLVAARPYIQVYAPYKWNFGIAH